jgi:hypothetical protein
MPGPYNTGRDISVDVTGPNGIINLSIVTDFSRKQDVTKLKSAGLDGFTRHYNVPDGWSGSLTLDRANRSLDDLIAAYETAYYAGSSRVQGTITETIQEVDGSISQWRYTLVEFECPNAGDWKKDSKVEPKLDWVATRRIAVQ